MPPADPSKICKTVKNARPAPRSSSRWRARRRPGKARATRVFFGGSDFPVYEVDLDRRSPSRRARAGTTAT